MDIETVKTLADGRVYTAEQAEANGLIDKVEGWEDALSFMEETTGVEGYEVYFSSGATLFDYLFYKMEDIMPENEVETLNKMASSQLAGVPLYMWVA